MIEHNPSPEPFTRAVLVQVIFSSESVATHAGTLSEFKQLIVSAGVQPCTVLSVKLLRPDAKWFIGSGKVTHLSELLANHHCDLVIINAALSPTQQRNLEQALCVRVLDRTELILDIFAQRAHTHEGKLQVELAQLQHLSTRLVRGWTHLERQKGGIGLRGPGETQLETDRRLLRNRIKLIQARLEKVRSQRQQSRRARRKAEIPVIALVGYTNVGKSSLFNRLTTAQVYAEDKLFATLDPTLRQIDLPGYGPVILVDTVGFVRDLPHALIKAFRATLEETINADLLLHVQDISDPERHAAQANVLAVLEEIGADQLARLIVYNKLDLLTDEDQVGINPVPHIDYTAQGLPKAVWLSVQQNQGMELLLSALAEILHDRIVHCCVLIAFTQSKYRAWLHQEATVLNEELVLDTQHYRLEIQISRVKFQKIQLELAVFGLNESCIKEK